MLSKLTIVVVVFLAVALPGAASTGPTLPQVTLISDSVADGIQGDSWALQALETGAAVQLQIAPCRRVDGESCPYGGVKPPTVVELVKSLGSQLGPYVVIEVGYNDWPDEYGQNIENALSALQTAGVKHVWWLNLHEGNGPYVQMNQTIAAEAAAHAGYMSVIDWNGYSQAHPEWFQSDGVHLLRGGAEGMATLIHQTLIDAGVAVKPVSIATSTLPVARKGRPYAVQLATAGGLTPFRWAMFGHVPKGLHLLASGALSGTPRTTGSFQLRFRVSDAQETAATQTLTLRVVR